MSVPDQQWFDEHLKRRYRVRSPFENERVTGLVFVERNKPPVWATVDGRGLKAVIERLVDSDGDIDSVVESVLKDSTVNPLPEEFQVVATKGAGTVLSMH
ncbi:MAG: hypothetical protein HOL17_06255 [Gammaproteobacteria bacterium]|jgi:hypothetical protein|nr:hypothetical protein [Gammaproteobacteria bacterium]MBT4606032.1 hypothetical protein [Thiotrichales bacterium]MBT7829784.1 hypothetical protein [Candidatus Neomarinimicrobiota bacterium]MBT4329546.1 hypothetical protein [Gammaproteobacteria bacterium]MBT5371309.1 hypothetical protein [Gammaproteobacteria bacterium]